MRKREGNKSETVLPQCLQLKILQRQKALVTSAGSGIGRSVAVMMKSIAQEFAQDKVRVNGIAPRTIKIQLLRKYGGLQNVERSYSD